MYLLTEDKTAVVVVASYHSVSKNPVRFKALLRTLVYGCAYEGSNPDPQIWVHQNCIFEILVHDANLLLKIWVLNFVFKTRILSTLKQFCRIKGCGGAGRPLPSNIFERRNKPWQIMYHFEGNLWEIPN